LLEEIPMNRLSTCAVALGLLAFAPAALAQQGDRHDDRRDAASQSAKPHSQPVDVRKNAPGGKPRSETANTPQYKPAAATGPAHARTRNAGTHNAGPGNALSNRGPSSVQRNTSVQRNAAGPSHAALRRSVQASRHFHNGNYRAPQGYHSRHWSHGDYLPRGYFVRSYWIGDFLAFGLFAPPDGLVWVRVGNDALLIDRYSGEIVQVDYGVFY
jgi:Ni/Co efflux regulator RcnB